MLRSYALRPCLRRATYLQQRCYVTDADVRQARMHCGSQLRKADRDAYLIRPFVPGDIRDFYDAIRALNLELVRLPETVSNESIQKMRLAFWQESLDATFAGRPPREPICILLHHALDDLAQRELSAGAPQRIARDSSAPQSIRFWLNRFLRLRAQQMNNHPFATLQAWDEAGSAYGMLLYASLAATRMDSSLLDHVASHVGKGCDMVALLRGIPVLAAGPKSARAYAGLGAGARTQQRLLLPLDVMAKAGLKEEDVFRKGPHAPGLLDAVCELASLANQHVLAAREQLRSVQGRLDAAEGGGSDLTVNGETDIPQKLKRGFWVLLHAVPCLGYLKDLERHRFDPFAVRRSWTLPLKIWRTLVNKKI